MKSRPRLIDVLLPAIWSGRMVIGKAQVARGCGTGVGRENTRKNERATVEVVDTSKQKLYTSALSSKRVRRQYSRTLSRHNLNKGELKMGGDIDIIKGGEPTKKKAKKKAAPKKAAKKKAAKKKASKK